MPSNRFSGDVIDIATHSDSALERHYSVDELAKIWGLSRRTIRRIFGDDRAWCAGAIRSPAISGDTLGYITLRTPESVVQRVHPLRTRIRHCPALPP